MKVRKKEYLIFILIIAFMTLFFQGVYMIMTNNEESNTMEDWFINFPLVLIMGFTVLVIIHKINKHFKYKNDLYKRVLFELLVVTLFAGAYVIPVKYFCNLYIFGYSTSFSEYLKSVTVVLLGIYYFVFILELFLYNQRQSETEKLIAVIEKERLEYLYATLKTQVNPHFLFNSLNILSSLAFEDPHKANIYTKKLSNIYRYALSTNIRQSVALKEEIAFLESYIYLVSIRFEEALRIEIETSINK